MLVRFALVLTLGVALSACASVDLPDIDFMGTSDFDDDIATLESSFPRPEDTPLIPTDVRTAAEWDDTARGMERFLDLPDAPQAEPALSPAEFDRQFENARAATESYKADDPQ